VPIFHNFLTSILSTLTENKHELKDNFKHLHILQAFQRKRTALRQKTRRIAGFFEDSFRMIKYLARNLLPALRFRIVFRQHVRLLHQHQ